jgi:hypothetical protein
MISTLVGIILPKVWEIHQHPKLKDASHFKMPDFFRNVLSLDRTLHLKV